MDNGDMEASIATQDSESAPQEPTDTESTTTANETTATAPPSNVSDDTTNQFGGEPRVCLTLNTVSNTLFLLFFLNVLRMRIFPLNQFLFVR